MRRTIYSRPKAPKPKTIALELPDDHTPTDPSPHTQPHLGGGIGGTSLPEGGGEAGVTFSGSTDIHLD
jgi:hypothetical protein